MGSIQEKYNALVIKYDALLAENEELKSILSQHGIVYSSIKRADESTTFSSILMQSCFENDEVKPSVKGYGIIIVDECHHVSSIT